jgi:outer membrane protein X
VTVGFGAKAQEAGDVAAGVNLAAGFGNEFTNVGIGAKFQYNVTAPVRAEGSFTFFPKKDGLGMWDLSVNGHYLIGIPSVSNFTVYPVAGLGLTGYTGGGGGGEYEWQNPITGEWEREEYESEEGEGGTYTVLGLNLGGGAEYKLTDRIRVNAELKYRIGFDSDVFANRFLISAGIAYTF